MRRCWIKKNNKLKTNPFVWYADKTKMKDYACYQVLVIQTSYNRSIRQKEKH